MGGQRIILFQPSDSRKLLAYQYQTAAREQNELGGETRLDSFSCFLLPELKDCWYLLKEKEKNRHEGVYNVQHKRNERE